MVECCFISILSQRLSLVNEVLELIIISILKPVFSSIFFKKNQGSEGQVVGVYNTKQN